MKGLARSEYAIETAGNLFAVELGRPMRVGRDPTCEICLDSLAVSRMHAWFWIERGELWVEDLDSRNGVYVDGGKATRQRVDLGMRVLLGDRVLTIVPADGSRIDTTPVLIDDATSQRVTDETTTVFEVLLGRVRAAMDGGDPLEVILDRLDRMLAGLEAAPAAIDPRLLDTMSPLVDELAARAADPRWTRRLEEVKRRRSEPPVRWTHDDRALARDSVPDRKTP